MVTELPNTVMQLVCMSAHRSVCVYTVYMHTGSGVSTLQVPMVGQICLWKTNVVKFTQHIDWYLCKWITLLILLHSVALYDDLQIWSSIWVSKQILDFIHEIALKKVRVPMWKKNAYLFLKGKSFLIHQPRMDDSKVHFRHCVCNKLVSFWLIVKGWVSPTAPSSLHILHCYNIWIVIIILHCYKPQPCFHSQYVIVSVCVKEELQGFSDWRLCGGTDLRSYPKST